MQVRLDEAAQAIVSARRDAGDGSAAQIVNRIIHAAAADPAPDRRPTAAQTADAARPVVPPPAPRPRARSERSEVVRPSTAPRRPTTPRPTARTARAQVPRCPHPLLRRVGDKCANCGETVTT